MAQLCKGCNKVTKVKGQVCGKDLIRKCMECGHKEHEPPLRDAKKEKSSV
jgi:hypothetical protein